MKSSRYNLLINLESGGLLAFNGASAALAEIDTETRNRFEQLLNGKISPVTEGDRQLLEQMRFARFICPADSDEVAEIKQRDTDQRRSLSTLSLTIAPTLACNFRCDYCFQSASATVMSPDVENALVSFAEKRMQGTEALMLTWFGGEPTLCMKTVINLQSRLYQRGANCGVKEFSSSMITNGYLLDRKMAEQLSEIGIGEVQVTLDGPPAVHDHRRRLANGHGTFEQIMANLGESSEILRVIVRINIDTANSGSALEVVDILEQRGLLDKINIYFAPVNPAKGVCSDASGRCLSTAEFSRTQVELYSRLVDRGVRRIEYPQLASGGYCGAGHDNSFVVGPNGLLFKCWEELSLDVGASVGDIFESERSGQQQANWDRYQNHSAFDRSACVECSILPLCLGGCPLYATGNGSHEFGYCSPWKYNLREMLMLRYKCNNH